MTLSAKILARFKEAEDVDKVTMMGNMPIKLARSIPHAMLGGSVKVWCAYIKHTGADGIRELSQMVLVDHVYPLIVKDESSYTIRALLGCGYYIEACVAELVIRYRRGESMVPFKRGLGLMAEQAMPLILEMMKSDKDEVLEMALSFVYFNIWTNASKVIEITDVAFDMMVSGRFNDVLKPLSMFIARGNPKKLIEYVLEQPVYTHGRVILFRSAVVEAYSRVSVPLKIRFILATVEDGVLLSSPSNYETILMLSQNGVETMKSVLMKASPDVLELLARAISVDSIYTPSSNTSIVSKSLFEALSLIFCEEGNVKKYFDFLIAIQHDIGEYYYHLVKVAEGFGHDTSSLINANMYASHTIAEIIDFMYQAEGAKQVGIALVALEKLKTALKVKILWPKDRFTLQSQIGDVSRIIIVGLSQNEFEVPAETGEALRTLNLKYWYHPGLDLILRGNNSYWAVYFSVYCLLGLDPNNQYAKGLVAQAMKSNDPKVMKLLEYLDLLPEF